MECTVPEIPRLMTQTASIDENSPEVFVKYNDNDYNVLKNNYNQDSNSGDGLRISEESRAADENVLLRIVDCDSSESEQENSRCFSNDDELVLDLTKVSREDSPGKQSNDSPNSETTSFCSLCQKEFCNKYFLRTHMANRHGVIDSSSTVYLGSSVMSHFKFSTPKTIKAEPVVNAESNNNNHTTFKSSETALEDFCEVCQKHFCNKYYLRKHKADVHGIYTDYIKQAKSSDTSPRSTGINIAMTIASSQNQTISSSVPYIPNIPGMSASLMLMNPYLSPLMHPSPLLVRPSFFDQKYQPSLFTPGSLMFTQIGNSSFMYDKNKTENTVSCDVCKKEFYNTDYLKLHKANRHGEKKKPSEEREIAENENDHKDEESDNKSDDSIDDHKEQCTNDNDASLADASVHTDENDHDLKTEDSLIPESFCVLCKRDFGSIYLLREHFISFHRPKSTAEKFADSMHISNTLNNTISAISSYNENNLKQADHKTSTNGLMDSYFAAKLADRVVCDICNKQVCNKYFLKTHKVKVHGIGSDKSNSDHNEFKLDLSNDNARLSPTSDVEETGEECTTLQPLSEEEKSELLKNGVDPEAYCTVCKKEFCSKYFLRTHQQNIHKIKQTNNGVVKRPRTFLKELTKNKLLSPAQTRVTCVICNKELCNKYFLRSHMLNVHNVSNEEVKSEISPSCDEGSKTTEKGNIQLIKTEQTTVNEYHTNMINDEKSACAGLFKCAVCGECLKSQTECNEHSRSVHGNNSAVKRSSNNLSFQDLSSTPKESRYEMSGFSGMQPFIVESDDPRFNEFFVPCMVYLPIKSRINSPVSFHLNLKPVGHENIIRN